MDTLNFPIILFQSLLHILNFQKYPLLDQIEKKCVIIKLTTIWKWILTVITKLSGKREISGKKGKGIQTVIECNSKKLTTQKISEFSIKNSPNPYSDELLLTPFGPLTLPLLIFSNLNLISPTFIFWKKFILWKEIFLPSQFSFSIWPHF